MTDRDGETGDTSDTESLHARLDEMERLFKRRFDELSMEVNAASQLVGMAEDSVKQRFSEIFEILEAISYTGDGSSRVQAGVELDAVIKITEDAANRILDSADRIGTRLENDAIWTDAASRTQAIADTMSDVQEILMACAFQDLTGQRIRNTLENLQLIEARLANTLSKFGIQTEVRPDGVARYVRDDLSQQSDVDALFETGDSSDDSGNRKSADNVGKTAQPASQDDIDALFD